MDGISSPSIFELDNAKRAEGITAVSDDITGFFGVPGYTYEIDAGCRSGVHKPFGQVSGNDGVFST